MMQVDDLIKQAWAALLRGDTAERDRLIGLARNVMSLKEDPIRFSQRDPISVPPKPRSPIVICLPDRSSERVH